MKVFFLILFLIGGQMGCQEPSKPEAQQQQVVKARTVAQEIDSLPAADPIPENRFLLPYDLDTPEETLKLSALLTEISGLSLSSAKTKLCAVQDEEGLIFMVDKKDGKIGDTFKFWKKGDYEGVEIVGSDAYVVKSTGTVYEVKNMGTDAQEVTKYNTFLSRENDVEGLAYDPATNALLIACKGLPGTGESFELLQSKKVIYEFNLETKKINPDPVYTISLEAIQGFLKYNKWLKGADKLITFFQPNESLTFAPSAVAVHPISRHVYVMSSTKKILVVLNVVGEIINITKLNKKIHRQPEGITFEKDGTMYISNEGKGGIAKIHRFSYQK